MALQNFGKTGRIIGTRKKNEMDTQTPPPPPNGYRLATKDDKKLPKPNTAMFYHTYRDEWLNIIYDGKWSPDSIYAVPNNWNKKEETMSNLPSIPEGYRLVTEEDRKHPKPLEAMWLDSSVSNWIPVDLQWGWIENNIYIVPTNWNKKEEVMNDLPTPPDGYRLATEQDKKHRKDDKVFVYHESMEQWIPVITDRNWLNNGIYAVPIDWNPNPKDNNYILTLFAKNDQANLSLTIRNIDTQSIKNMIDNGTITIQNITFNIVRASCETHCHNEIRAETSIDSNDPPVGWRIISIDNGFMLCESPTGKRRTYWFK